MPVSNKRASSKLSSVSRRQPSTPVVDIDTLPPSALCTTRQLAEISGFAEITLKVWRRAGGEKGPRFVMVEGRPRYRVGDVRNWLSSADV